MAKMTEDAKEIAEEIRAGMIRLKIPGGGCFIGTSDAARVLGKYRGTIREMFKDLPRYGPQKEYKVNDIAVFLDQTKVHERYGA